MKKSIIPVAAFIAGMVIVPSVFAADNTYTSWTDLASNCLQATVDVVCKLGGDIIEQGNSTYALVNGGKNITLDLNGHKLALTASDRGAIDLQSGNLTIANGTIVSNNATNNAGTIYARGGTLTIVEDATIEGVNPVVVRSGTPEVIIAGTLNNNVKGAADAAALWVHGDADNSTVTLTGTARLSSTVGAGLYQTAKAKTTVNPDVVITGQTGILIKSGELTLNGATVTGNGTWDTSSVTAGTSGYSKLTGAAIQIEGFNNEDITIDIDNSIIESENGSPLFSYGSSGTVKSMTIDDSYLKAKDAETALHAHDNTDIKWTAWAVDGDTKINLAETKGELGTMPTIADEGEDEGEENENPNTADTIATYLTIATVALLGLGATAFVAKKSNR